MRARGRDVDFMAQAGRYRVAEIETFVGALFVAGGLDVERAGTLARVFLEADLLGYSTHGLQRVPINLHWLEQGHMRATGAPAVLRDRQAVFAWDADRLPGPWVLAEAVRLGLDRVRATGVVAATIARCTHVACLAAYLPPVLEAGCVGLLTVSTPDERFISPFGAHTPVFSNNPLAFCAPTDGAPLLFDVSMAIAAGGRIARARQEGRRLAELSLKTHDGSPSDDPRALETDPPGSVLPIGGLVHGYKGYALTLMTEVLSQVLAGHGRVAGAGEGEANSVFLEILDPSAFADRADYLREMGTLLDAVRRAVPDDPAVPVRIPGEAAWARRAAAQHDGVTFYPGVFERLLPWAARFGVTVPEPCGPAPVKPRR